MGFARQASRISIVGALAAGALLLMAVLALAVPPTDAPGQSDECAGLTFLTKFEAPFSDPETQDGVTVDFTGTNSDGEEITFTWTSTTPIDRVVVKAGNTGDVTVNYDEATSGGPISTVGGKGISHITFCFDRESTTTTEAQSTTTTTEASSTTTTTEASSTTTTTEASSTTTTTEASSTTTTEAQSTTTTTEAQSTTTTTEAENTTTTTEAQSTTTTEAQGTSTTVVPTTIVVPTTTTEAPTTTIPDEVLPTLITQPGNPDDDDEVLGERQEAAPDEVLPFTGADTGSLLALAGLFMSSGGGVLLAARSRRRRAGK